MENSLEDKVVLVTGASSGIGKATAIKLAAEGAKLAITYFGGKEEADKADETAKLCRESGSPEVLVLELDVRDYKSIKNVVNNTVGNFEKIDILINNAGIIKWAIFSEQTIDSIENQIRINLEGVIKMTYECLPHIKEMIVNIASGAGIRPHPTAAVYCATKYGVRGFTQTLGLEYPNLKIYAVNPDRAATQMTNFDGRSPEVIADIILRTAEGEFKVENGGDVNVWEILHSEHL